MMPLKLLVTRAINEWEETAEALTGTGFDLIPCPLTNVIFHGPPLPEDPQAFLLSSRNAVRGLEAYPFLNKEIPVFTVGARTAALARSLGFHKVMEGGGNVASMIPFIIRHCQKKDRPLVYLRGADIRFDLTQALQDLGFVSKEVILYTCQTLPVIPEAVVRLLTSPERESLRGVVFFSFRGFQRFQTFLLEKKIGSGLENLFVFGLAPWTEKPLIPGGRPIFSPQEPTLQALKTLITETRCRTCHIPPPVRRNNESWQE